MKLGKLFLNNLKDYLSKIGFTSNEINDIKDSKIISIFKAADAADGKEDGKVTGENFFAMIKEEFKDKDFSLTELEQEYLDAWQALAGEDNILETSELEADEEAEPTTEPTSPSGSGGGGGDDNNVNNNNNNNNNNNTNNNNDNGVPEVTAESLEGKDASTLRTERGEALNQIDTVRSEMETAEAQKKTDVANKKTAYEDLLKQLAEVSDVKNENNKSLKDLQSEKSEKEQEVTNQQTQIKTTKDNITASKENITSIQNELSSLKEPDKSQFTTKDENGETSFNEAEYNAALEEYNSKKADLETRLADEQDNLSTLEQQLTTDEKTLKEKEEAVSKIEGEIVDLIVLISKTDTENKELITNTAAAMEAYLLAQDELKEIKKPFEDKIEVLNKNLSVYDNAITKAEQTEREEKEKFTSEIKDENALVYKNGIDALYGDNKEEEDAEEADEDEDTADDDTSKQEELKDLLETALNDKNISTEDKMKLLAYAKTKDEKLVKNMLKDDTFFVKAFAEMADDEQSSTERLLAMQDVYFDIQGDTEISTNFFTANGELQGSYIEAAVSLIEKAIKNGNLDKVIKNYERNGISLKSIEETIKNSTAYTEDQKNELLERMNIDKVRENPEVTVQKVNIGGLEAEMSMPKDIKDGEELPVLVFFTGCKQKGAYNGKDDNGRYLMYDDGTTPLGTMYDANTSWTTENGGSHRVIDPEYKYNLSSFPGIIIEINSDDTTPAENLKTFFDEMDNNGINGVKVKRGKTVVAGASAGVTPAYSAAMGLGSNYIDELIVISNNPKNHFDNKNASLNGITTYGYVADAGETSYYNNMLHYIAGVGSVSNSEELQTKNRDENGNEIVSKVKGRSDYASNHHHVVNLMFTNDLDGDGYCDFFQKHFGKYYHKRK